MDGNNKNILIDCERMKYPNTGLYHFCKQLGLALLEPSINIQKLITFYVRENEEAIFGENANYLKQHSLHKFVLPSLSKFTIWHATYQGTMYYPYARNIKVVLTVHDLNFMHEDNRPVEKKNRELKRLQQKINRADVIVAISNFVKEDLFRFINMNGKEVNVIYNGCNINSTVIPVKPLTTTDHPFIFTIGTIIDKKNFHVIPSLLANNDLNLVIAGTIQSELYKAKILDEAKKYNAENRIIFAGSISEQEKYWYLQNCKSFIFPSLMEGFGLPVIEAMAFGKPVFLSNLTSLPEIGSDQAFYFNDFNPTHMQQVYEEGMRKYEAGEMDIELIKKRANFFSWKNAALGYAKIYNQLNN